MNRKCGVPVQMITALQVTTATLIRLSLNWYIISLSILATSLEKRLTILPTGVVSKKLIGERRTFLSNPACSFLDVFILA